jgi:hypothetical protein
MLDSGSASSCTFSEVSGAIGTSGSVATPPSTSAYDTMPPIGTTSGIVVPSTCAPVSTTHTMSVSGGYNYYMGQTASPRENWIRSTERSYVLLCTIKRIISSYVAAKYQASLKFTTSVSFLTFNCFLSQATCQHLEHASSKKCGRARGPELIHPHACGGSCQAVHGGARQSTRASQSLLPAARGTARADTPTAELACGLLWRPTQQRHRHPRRQRHSGKPCACTSSQPLALLPA